MARFKMCGLCGRTILPLMEESVKMEFNGEVHKRCKEEFDKKSILHKLKGVGESDT